MSTYNIVCFSNEFKVKNPNEIKPKLEELGFEVQITGEHTMYFGSYDRGWDSDCEYLEEYLQEQLVDDELEYIAIKEMGHEKWRYGDGYFVFINKSKIKGRSLDSWIEDCINDMEGF